MQEFPKRPANYVALSPMSFLARTQAVHPERLAVVYGETRMTWRQTGERCRRLASALALRGVGRGHVVAVFAPNTPPTLEAHFGVPMLGAVLNAMNVRLDAETIATVLAHGQARVLIADREFSVLVAAALDLLPPGTRPLVIDIDDPQGAGGAPIGEIEYEAFLRTGDPDFGGSLPYDEWDAIALNYTSGTTGRPKGVVYHHRGAYLAAIGNVMTWGMQQHPVYLWTLPMFHCNGWSFPWAVTALAGTHVCLRRVEAGAILAALDAEHVTHLCGAPVIMGMILHHPAVRKRPRTVRMMTAGAAPPAAVIEGMEGLGFAITHVYGLTECYGPVTVCEWKPAWDELGIGERAAIKARQGVPYVVQEELMVADPATMRPVPQDGVTMGELFLRGNVTMKGYLDNEAATDAIFADGWMHTGDLGVWHEHGYAEVKDRSKDIIISGGENISTIEVESVLYRHPAVLEAAVVARPDPVWGETPCAFVALRPGAEASAADIVAFCRARMAHYKAPRHVVFGALPKTSTGKMQKFLLREQARAAAAEPPPGDAAP